MLEFVEALYRITAAATDGFGVVDRDFGEILEEAYNESGFKIAKEAVLKKFIGSNAEIYYREIREVRAKKLTVITTQDVTNAERIVEALQNNEFTKDIMTMETNERYTVINQLKIDDYIVDGHSFKSMLDKVIIDNNTKTVFIYDLKCVWAVEGFYTEYYLYRRAYIQAYLYYKAVSYLANQITSPFYGYTVNYPQFIVCDSINYNDPLIYTLSEEDMVEAYAGFEHNDRKYPGVKELIEGLKWAIDNDKWTISKKNYEAKGFVNIKSW